MPAARDLRDGLAGPRDRPQLAAEHLRALALVADQPVHGQRAPQL